MQRLGAPARADQLGRQEFQELGVSRRRAGVAQVVGRGGQPRSEVVLPDPVGQHPGQQCRGPRAGPGEPPCQGQPPARRARPAERRASLVADCPGRPGTRGRRGRAVGPGVLGLPRRKSGDADRLGPEHRQPRRSGPGCGRRRAFSASITLSSRFCLAVFLLGSRSARVRSARFRRAISASIILLVGPPGRQDVRAARPRPRDRWA